MWSISRREVSTFWRCMWKKVTRPDETGISAGGDQLDERVRYGSWRYASNSRAI